jgi:hypothetical protein
MLFLHTCWLRICGNPFAHGNPNQILNQFKNMKTQIIPLIAAVLIMTSCDENKEAERQKTMAKLEFFVDSVENELSASASHNWAEIEREYERLEANAEDAWENAKGEEKDNLDELEDRFAEIKADAEKKTSELRADAKKHMGNLENWLDRAADKTAAGAKNAGEEVEEGVEESIEWLEENYEQLEDKTKKEFDEIKSKWSEPG